MTWKQYLTGLALVVIAALALCVVFARAGEAYSGPRQGYTYNWQTHDYVKVFVAESVFVPVAVPTNLFVNVNPLTYPVPLTISPQYQQQVQSGTDLRLKSLEDSLSRIEKLLGTKAGGGAPTSSAPPSASQDSLPPGAQPQQGQRQVTPATLAAAGVIKQHCAQCHTAPDGRNALNLFNARGEFDLAIADPMTIYAAVRKDAMPKGPNKLSPQDKALIRAWALETE